MASYDIKSVLSFSGKTLEAICSYSGLLFAAYFLALEFLHRLAANLHFLMKRSTMWYSLQVSTMKTAILTIRVTPMTIINPFASSSLH